MRALKTLTLMTAAALTACGGGGGDDAARTATAIVGSANAPTISGAVLNAALGAADAGDLTGFGAAPATVGLADPNFARVGALASAALDPFRATTPFIALQVVVGPETSDCALGGTVTTTGNIATPGTLASNDTLTLEFDGCTDAEGTIDGLFAMSIASFSGDLLSGQFTLGLRVNLDNLSIASNAGTATLDGDMTLTIAVTTNAVTTTIVSTSMTVAELGAASHTLTNLMLTQAVDAVTDAFTLDVEGMLTSSAFAGSVTFDTIVPFGGTGLDYPSSGELLVTGANGGTIRVVVLDSTFVRLELDANGDGTVDERVDVAWSEIV
jgi:hypothetical protein